MASFVIGIALCGLIGLLDAAPLAQEADAESFLVRYGYLGVQDHRTGALRTEDSFRQGIIEFQEFNGLNVTGVLDRPTIELMGSPRCGVGDKIGPGSFAKRKRRYTLQGSSWPTSKPLTYRITKYSTQLTESEIDEAVDTALQAWSDVSNLRFEKKAYGNVDIDIKFLARNHGDGNPFDGPGKVLAHAFFPQFGGDAHFDEDERWTVKTSRGINLFQVAAHEFGHSLGLSHSQDRNALMAPFYRGYQENFELDSDDISAIQVLYGANRQRTTTTTRPRSSTESAVARRPPSSLCDDPKIDAVTRTKDGTTYVFKGLNYYRLNTAGIDAGYPRRISWDWDGLDGPVDAALTVKSGNTYIFKGSQYWKFVNLKAVRNYPKPISAGFPNIPSNMDAAFIWSGNGQPYFVKGNQYWRYSFTTYSVASGYPRPLRSWKNLPSTVDAVFEWENDRTYFFKNGNYYRFHDKNFGVDVGYPRSIAEWWFGCSGPKDSQPIGQDPNKGSIVHEVDNKDNQYEGLGVDANRTLPDGPKSDPKFDRSVGDGHNAAPSTFTWSLATYAFLSVCVLIWV